MNQPLFPTMKPGGFSGCLASLLNSGWMYYVILGLAILLVTGLVVLWAVLIRKKPRERRYKYRRAQPVVEDSTTTAKNERRRRRRSEPRRNPTLAETRGLPPARDEQSASTEHYQH